MKGKLKMMKRAVTNFDMGKYILVVGKDATDIFKFYDVKQMHGLNLKDAQAEEVDKTKGNGVYIYGLTNYNPADKKLTAKSPYKPFIFLNMGTFKKYKAEEQKTAKSYYQWNEAGQSWDLKTIS